MLIQQIPHPLFEREKYDETLLLKVAPNPRSTAYRVKQNEYNQVMRYIVASPSPRIVFDMSDCQKLDSVTVGILVSLSIETIRQEGNVALCCVAQGIQNILAELMLLEPKHRHLTWKIYSTVEDAVESLSGG